MMKPNSRRGGLAAVVLGSAIGVGSMSGCGAALLGGAAYLAAEEIAQSNVEAARIRANALASARGNENYTSPPQLTPSLRKPTVFDSRPWKGEPLESHFCTVKESKDFCEYEGHLKIYEEGIQFDTSNVRIGSEPERAWWIAIPYSAIRKVSNTEQYRGSFFGLGLFGDDHLIISYEGKGGLLKTITFDIFTPLDADKATEDTDCTLLADSIRNRVQELE